MKVLIIAIAWLYSLFLFWLVLLGGVSVDGVKMCKATTNYKLQTEIELCSTQSNTNEK